MKIFNVFKPMSIVGAMMMLMFGCREYHFYRYKPAVVTVAGGWLVVNAEGSFGESSGHGAQRQAYWGFPYDLQFKMEMPFDRSFLKFGIRDVVLIGDRTGRRTSLPDASTDEIKDFRSNPHLKVNGRIAILTPGKLEAQHFEYEALTVEATVVIYREDGSVEEEKIRVRLETDYEKQWRSDKLDEEMSV